MAVPATISVTESQCFTVLGNFILSVLSPSVDVSQGQQNRVPSTSVSDFVIMTSLRRVRLGTNETTYVDNEITASITGTTMDVTATTDLDGPGIQVGMQIVDGNWPNTVAADTTVVALLTGTGGIGSYTVNNSQTVTSETMYANQRQDLEETEFTVQVDVYGPNSGNNAQILSTLLRSEFATEFFYQANPAIAPLHADDPRQNAFVSGEAQFIDRYSVDVHLQVNPVVGSPQQVATAATVTPVDVEGSFPP